MRYLRSLVWFRRDLRNDDHAALYHALKNTQLVHCVFVFDTDILDQLSDNADRRVEFIWESVRELKSALQMQGSDLIVLHGKAIEEIPNLAVQLKVNAVFSNRDYEPTAKQRDTEISTKLAQLNIDFHQFKDQVLFEQDELLTKSGKPYVVFTPYKKSHLEKLNAFYLKPYPVNQYSHHLVRTSTPDMMTLQELGFSRTNLSNLKLPTGMSGANTLFSDFSQRIQSYREARNYPAVKGVSYLSTHLRFGTISVRQLARLAWEMNGIGAEAWLSELIWRDFYFQLLHHHPCLAQSRAFKPMYEHLVFENNLEFFQAWCEGRTGYPLVDAAMRQLNQTGYMHNRLRMVTASFLVKDLLIDWRWGERYFAQKLIDFDFAANNGGWQWAASTGCDAQPWFRIFNPITQSETYDPQGQFLRKYLPELAKMNDYEIHRPWQSLLNTEYPTPIVVHELQRKRALDLYKAAQVHV